MDVKAEIDDLKRRVGDLEGAVNVLTGQFGKIHPEILAIKRESAEGFERINKDTASVIARVDTLNSQVWSLRDDLPAMLGEAVGSINARFDRN